MFRGDGVEGLGFIVGEGGEWLKVGVIFMKSRGC